jgi:KaiC/GvpD/RAD55 family RecA-like ATPase
MMNGSCPEKGIPMDINRQEIEYKWFEAAKSYEQTLESKEGNDPDIPEFWEKIGFCYNMASRQALDLEEFSRFRQSSTEAYEKAGEVFGKTSSLENKGRSAECFALAAYMRSWIASNSEDKDENLRKCQAKGGEALEIFGKAGDNLKYGETCNILSQCLLDRVYLASVEGDKKKLVLEGLDLSADAISVLMKLKNNEALLHALSLATLQSWYYANIGETEDLRKDFAKKCLAYSEKATELSKEVVNSYSKEVSLWAVSLAVLFFTEKLEASLEYAKEMWEQACLMGDNYFMGIASYLLAFITDLMIPGEASPTRRKQLYENVIGYSGNAIKHLNFVGQESAIAEVYLVYPQSYFSLAREFAVSPIEKLAFSKKAVRLGEKGLEHALRSGSSDAIASNLHVLSKAYNYFANLEPRTSEKPELLKIALNYRREYVRIVQTAFTSNFWMTGLGLVYAAQTEVDLARLEITEEKKGPLLQEAISDMNEGILFCEKWIESLGSYTQPSLVATVAGFEDSFGTILKENYLFTGNRENLTQAIQVYDRAVENFKKVDLPSRVAESYWKMAGNYDFLGDYEKAANNFEKSFAGYKVAAHKIEQFSDFYFDYSNYMKAWREIMNAKIAHNGGQYEVARQYYEKASCLLGQSKLWKYLSLNFHAWSILEEAEDLSRREESIESIKSFENAIKFLQESKKALETELEKIERKDEKALVENLVKASEARATYSLGRIDIEEAKMLNIQGNYINSSQKYGDAAKIFEKIALQHSEQNGKEAKPLVFLCQAWEKMTMATARNSPILFEEAAELFKKANEHAMNESAGLLALAHSSFCKALEAGTEFEITRNKMIYKESKKYLDEAANYYQKAGFSSFSEYTKGTQNLFDAYVFMDSAKKETDLEKEANFFLMAERVLQVSIDAFAKAKHQDKADQVQCLLQKVKEEKELAVSLSEVFHAPTVTSSTGSFTTLIPTHEVAVGLERFEHADIQAKTVLQSKEVNVGEDTDLKIQILNVGKDPLQLVRIENILPASFQLVKTPEGYSFENLQLTTMGKQLDPLRTEEIHITLRAFKSGVFEVRPKIICADETGQQITFATEPATYKILDAILPDRIPTGYKDLDSLLLGGLPKEYAIVLTSPSNDEREILVKKFLETGVKNGEITFYITTEVGSVKTLAEEYQSNFYLFVCNPRADAMIKSLPNVYKLKGVDNLTDLDISLIKAFRTLDSLKTCSRRACVEIVSDVLLQHRALTTRKWLSGLLPDLRSKGFTTLAIINPQMHPQEEVHAILGLFDGEIRISERETQMGLEKVLRVRRLYNRQYVENELLVTRQKLES